MRRLKRLLEEGVGETMKIQPLLTVIQGQGLSATRRVQKSEAGPNAAAKSDSTKNPEFGDVFELVSTENKRAAAQAPPQDMDAAEAILQKVKEGLKQLTREDLRRIHRLEGLVHFYTA